MKWNVLRRENGKRETRDGLIASAEKMPAPTPYILSFFSFIPIGAKLNVTNK